MSAIILARASWHSAPVAMATSSMAESPTYPVPRTPSITTCHRQHATWARAIIRKLCVVVVNGSRRMRAAYLEVFCDVVELHVALSPLVALVARPHERRLQLAPFTALWLDVHVQSACHLNSNNLNQAGNHVSLYQRTR